MDDKHARTARTKTGIALLVGGQAVLWLLQSHPNSGTVRHVLVGLQALIGFGLAGWVTMQHRRQQGRKAEASGSVL